MGKFSKTKWLMCAIVISVVIVGCHQSKEKAYEQKITVYQEKADEFKKTLPSEDIVLGEVIDSTVQRIYFLDRNTNEISVYDIEKQLTSVLWKIPFNEYKNIQHNQYENRLFITALNTESREQKASSDASILFCIDVLDNSTHIICPQGLSYVSLRQDGIFITIEGRDSDIKEYLANGNGGLSDEEIENLLQYKKKDKMSVPVPPTPDNQWEIQLSPFLSYTEYTSIIQEQNEKYDAWLHDVVTELYEKDAESRIEKELNWLDGRWVLDNYNYILINFTCRTMAVVMNGESIYNGGFTIEGREIVYDRHQGYYSTLDIDEKIQRIGDRKAGVWFWHRSM